MKSSAKGVEWQRESAGIKKKGEKDRIGRLTTEKIIIICFYASFLLCCLFISLSMVGTTKLGRV